MLYFNDHGDLVAGWRNIWGDWAMHLSQASSFSYQPILKVIENHPLYSGIPLTYPFVINLISGLLMRSGLDIVPAFILPSIFLSFLLLLALFVFGKVITNSSKQIILAITIFLCSGGLGFVYYFDDLSNNFSWSNVFYPPHEYTHMKNIGYYWTTTLLAHLVPQRAFLLGMVVGLFILSYLLFHFKNNFEKTSNSKMFIVGLITGLLSYIHNHTLIILFFISLWLFFWSAKKHKYWISFAIGATLTAIPFFLLFQGPNINHYMQFLPGWLANKKELNVPAWIFWIKNWGLLIPLFILAMSKLKIEKKLRVFIFGFVLIFFLANFFIFQPSSWDNAKIFLWVYLVFSFPVAGLLLKFWQNNSLGKLLAVILFFILIASGGIDLIRVLNTSKESFVMVDKQEIELAQFLRKNSTAQDIVLTSDEHLHWVPIIAGRNIVMGYRGWLWSYGIDYSNREQDIKDIYQGKTNALELIRKYNITFVVTDEQTKRDFNSNEEFFVSNFPMLIASPKYNVYTVK